MIHFLLGFAAISTGLMLGLVIYAVATFAARVSGILGLARLVPDSLLLGFMAHRFVPS